jgi:Beta-lactamase superfamily domain
MSRYYSGPVSDHFNGERFFDPGGVPPRSRRELNRWLVDRYWRGTRAKWPASAPAPYADRPPARVEGAGCRISYVGHASFLLQTAGLNILLDPVWSMRASPFRHVGPKRVNDPGIAFADLPPIDLVLVTHGHYDHLDVVTLSRLAASHRPLVIAPLGNMIRRSRPKGTIGTIALRSMTTSPLRLFRPGIGRRAVCPTAICRCGLRS